MRSLAIACLAATAAALRSSPVSVLRTTPPHRDQRSRSLIAQYGVQDLPAGWTTGHDQESGFPYYCDDKGQCQWDPPLQASDAQQGSPPAYTHELPAGWTTEFDPESGATYYCDAAGQCQWEPPQHTARHECGCQTLWQLALTTGWGPKFAGKYKLRNGEETVLGRYDMFSSKPYRPWVSRKQSFVRVEADGAAILVSRGKAPTGWRSRDGGPWQWLLYDDMKVLEHGDQVSLDYNEPEGTIFDCLVGEPQ